MNAAADVEAPASPGDELAEAFVAFAIAAGALKFGSFQTKAGRASPYFFNAGLFDDGARLGRLVEFYASRLLGSGIEFDMLFGPAYKGIGLVSALSVELARRGRNVPFAYNRKEAKDHGEGGTLVGAPMTGRVLIVDDVISAGTSVQESVALIGGAGASPCGVLIALDRQEKGRRDGVDTDGSAVQDVQRRLHLPVSAIATLTDLIRHLRADADPSLAADADRVTTYRQRYGV